MPHSGGGGSHGGGHHGGSHRSSGGSRGGSRPRLSRTYFQGARHFRKRYLNGKVEDYYSTEIPVKESLSSLIFISIFFGAIFLLVYLVIFITALSEGLNLGSNKLRENYDRPQSRIIDQIDILENKDELEEELLKYNDLTGICPIVMTMYTDDYMYYTSKSDYVAYNRLEKYAYDKYLEMFDDERHYLLIYAIPRDQASDYRTGRIEVPDFSWEIMVGDDTDRFYSEDVFVGYIHSELEKGLAPEDVFTKGFEKLVKHAQSIIDKPFYEQSMFMGFVTIDLVFVVICSLMTIPVILDTRYRYELVEKTDDGEAVATLPDNYQTEMAYIEKKPLFAYFAIQVPFFAVGLLSIYGGLDKISRSATSSRTLLVMGIIILVCMIGINTVTIRDVQRKRHEVDS